MVAEQNDSMDKVKIPSENFNIQLTDPMLYDRLCILSAEYSLSVELLVQAAVHRLVNDVDFVRGLHMGIVKEG